MADQYIERVENLIRVVEHVRDEDFNLWRWCDCAIGHAGRDAYFIEQGLDPAHITFAGYTSPAMAKVGEFFDISAARAASLFVPTFEGYGSRYHVLAALRVLLLEKMAQQIDDSVKPKSDPCVAFENRWSTPHIEELVNA
jgi:hypothetical protein